MHIEAPSLFVVLRHNRYYYFMRKIAIILYGPPGSGKGTQANLLADKLGLIHFDTGKFLESIWYDPKRQKEKLAATYKGVAGSGITTFAGIRYAAAPTGALRFAPPVAPAAVSGTINATSFGSPCPQTPSPFGKASTTEDCLFLNVYVPGSSVSSKKARRSARC